MVTASLADRMTDNERDAASLVVIESAAVRGAETARLMLLEIVTVSDAATVEPLTATGEAVTVRLSDAVLVRA